MSSRSTEGTQPDMNLAGEPGSQVLHSRVPGFHASLTPVQTHARLDQFSSQVLALEMQNRELREAQRTLERARSRYFEFFDSAPIPCLVFDERHHLEELNAIAVELLGGESAKWRHRPFFPHLIESDRQRFHHHIQTILKGRQRLEIELSLVSSGGKLQRLRLLSHFVLPEAGERPVCLSAVMPVPDRIAGASSHVAREALWGRHLNHAGIPAAVAALQGGWLYTNPAFRACLEYTEEELQSRGWLVLTHREDRDREVACYNRILAGEADSYQVEKRLVQKSGTTLGVRAAVSCLRTKDGRPDLLFYTLQILTPPAFVEQPSCAPFPIATDAGRTAVDLHELLSEGRSEFADPSAPCRVRWALAAGLPRLVVHRRQMLGVLHQLLRNAREAVGSGPGRITVSTGRQYVEADLFGQGAHGPSGCSGECIFLEVSDEGCGMSADVQSRACEPYFSTKAGHAGIGLTTVAAVMREHRGELRFHSQQGKGTSVQLIFPEALKETLVTEPHSTGLAVPKLADAPATAQRRVLLVDDEAGVREITARMIEALGFEVEEAECGAEGLSLYLRQPDRFAIVVADITMPGMDGLQLFDELRAHRDDLPFVLMSGFCEASTLSHREGGLGQNGSAVFLQKPFTFHRLQEVLESVQANPSWP